MKNKTKSKILKKNNILLIAAVLIITISIFSTNLKDLTGKTTTICTADNDPQCTDPTPICNTETNTCVECTENGDCSEICFENKCMSQLKGYFCQLKQMINEIDPDFTQLCT